MLWRNNPQLAAGGLLGRASTVVASAREVVPFCRKRDIVTPKLACILSCLGVFGVACGCYDVLPAVVLSITITRQRSCQAEALVSRSWNIIVFRNKTVHAGPNAIMSFTYPLQTFRADGPG